MTSKALSKLDISSSPLLKRPPASARSSLRPKAITVPPTNINIPEHLLKSQDPYDLFKNTGAIKERTYDLPSIIETDPTRRETFKYFVMEDSTKNPEKDKKRKITDFHVKRDTELEEIKLQQQTRLNVVEWQKKGRGTMFMSELWDSTFYIRVLKASGLDRIIDQIRRSRYQHKSRIGRRLEKEYKNKHSEQLKTEDHEHKALLKTERVQSARTSSARPMTYRFGTSTFPNSPNLIPLNHFEFNMTTEDEGESAAANNAKRRDNNLQDALYPMLIKEKHSRIKRGSIVYNTQIIKSARSTANPGQSDILSLNLLGDSEAIASLTHLDQNNNGKTLSRTSMGKSKRNLSLKVPTSATRLFVKTDESLPLFMRSPRDTCSTEPNTGYNLQSPSTARVRSYKSVASSKIGGQLKEILNQCHEVKENNMEMMNNVNQLHDLIEIGTQTRKSLRQAKESIMKKEVKKQEIERDNPQKHYRKCVKVGRKSTVKSGNMMEVYGL